MKFHVGRLMGLALALMMVVAFVLASRYGKQRFVHPQMSCGGVTLGMRTSDVEAILGKGILPTAEHQVYRVKGGGNVEISFDSNGRAQTISAYNGAGFDVDHLRIVTHGLGKATSVSTVIERLGSPGRVTDGSLRYQLGDVTLSFAQLGNEIHICEMTLDPIER